MASKFTSPADTFTDQFLSGTLTIHTVAAVAYPPNIQSYIERLVSDACEPQVTVTHENGHQRKLALSDAVADLALLRHEDADLIARKLLRGDEMFAGLCVYQLKARV